MELNNTRIKLNTSDYLAIIAISISIFGSIIPYLRKRYRQPRIVLDVMCHYELKEVALLDQSTTTQVNLIKRDYDTAVVSVLQKRLLKNKKQDL